MEHSSNIDIPFRIKLVANQNSFTIPFPRYKIDEGYNFSFDHLTLVPELYSKNAQSLDLDPESENEQSHFNTFQLEFEFDPSYYLSTPDSNKWAQTPAIEKNHSETILGINKFFTKNKPVGSLLPPLTIDWAARAIEGSGLSMDQFHKASALIFYGESFQQKHKNFVPIGAQSSDVNSFLFPTNILDNTVLESFRVRLHLAPNVKLGFSNDTLLSSLGFTSDQYEGKKSVSLQSFVSNPSPSQFKILVAKNKISDLLPTPGNRITVYPYSNHVVSLPGTVITKRGNLKKYSELASDYSIGIIALAEACNQSMTLEFDQTEKKFVFKFPENPKVKATVTVPLNMSQELGFGRKTRINKDSEAQVMEQTQDTKDLEKTARTIVYDVGMATVTLENSSNFQTVQFQNKVMATLEPEYDGTMRMKCSKEKEDNLPSISVSYFQTPELTFSLSRFSEYGQPVPIELPVGAYIQGRLVGKSIKAAI